MKTLLKNCHIISPAVDWKDAALLIDGETIAAVLPASSPLPAADTTVDCKGNYVMPGFVDVHCHGRNGSDFCDGTLEDITKMAKGKLEEGVTTLLPTTLTVGYEQLASALNSAAEYTASKTHGAKLPGVHLEGPYINAKCLGAQNPAFVRKPDIGEVKRISSIYPVLKVSYAVEVEGGDTFSEKLLAEGITPSCVHSAATYSQFKAAYDHKLRSLSHFCNQMTPLHHRDIGLVGAGLLHQDVYLELICDKLHVCPEMIQLIFSVKDINHIQLISDAMRASGMPDGKYDLGGMEVFVSGGAARLAAGNLAGSTLQICTALKNVYEITRLPLSELVKTTSFNQANALGLKNIGKLEKGYFADIAVLDSDFKVVRTFVSGK